MEDAASVWPPARRAWWAVAVFAAGAILSYTDRQILSLLVDPIRGDLHISDTQVSLLQGMAFALIYSIAGLPLGRLADLLPRRAVILAGVLVWTAATVACGLSRSFGALFLARVFVGVGEAALAPAAMSMITDLFPAHRRGTAIGVFIMGMVVGGGVALGIGGGLLEAARGGLFAGVPVLGAVPPWRAVLLVLGAPGLLIALLLLTVREPARRPGSGETAPRRYSVGEVVGELAARRRLVVPLIGAMALMSVGDFSLLNWTPALLSRNYRFSAGEIGALLGALVVATGVLGTVLGGLLSDRRAKSGGPRARIVAAAISATLALPLMAIGATFNAWQVLALLGWWNFFSSAAGTIGITALQEAVPNEIRGVGISLVAFGNIFGGLGLGTMTTALVTDRVFHDPTRVAASLSLVVGPAAVLATTLFWRAARRADGG
ncbi:MAG: MFS transporter [Caulobacteraceae bacterium]